MRKAVFGKGVFSKVVSNAEAESRLKTAKNLGKGIKKSMKVLLLSCNTGEGHNSAARAIKEQFDARGIPCTIENALAFASEKISEYVCNTYIKLTLRTPKLFGWGYRVGRDIASPKRKSPVYFANKMYADALGKYVEENGFDTVIMPHVFPAEAMTALRRHGKCNARLYAVSTDYSCCPFFEELEVDRYFIPHASLIPEFVDRGIPEEKLCVTGIPVSERFLQKTDKREARERLHLPQEGKIALIMTGSMGFGNTKAIAEELLECAPDMHLSSWAATMSRPRRNCASGLPGRSRLKSRTLRARVRCIWTPAMCCSPSRVD